jgi:hypothetical protein
MKGFSLNADFRKVAVTIFMKFCLFIGTYVTNNTIQVF